MFFNIIFISKAILTEPGDEMNRKADLQIYDESK